MKTNKDGTPRKTKYNWSAVNWSLSTHAIAQMLGAPKYYVEKMRSKLAPHTKQKSIFDTVDWSKSNMEIANETGMKYDRVYQHRKRNGIPKATKAANKITVSLAKDEWQQVVEKLRNGYWTSATIKAANIINRKLQ